MNDSLKLEDWHVKVLSWFEANAGKFFEDRPVDVGLGIPITDPYGKGIRKPNRKLTDYAISVYQSRKGSYPDQPPIEWGDGQWTYIYHQEGPSTEDPYKRGTNRGLMTCWTDGVPIGVLLPCVQNSVSGYRVMGLALIDDHSNGCFVLTGPVSIADASSQSGVDTRAVVSIVPFSTERFDPDAEIDDRQKVVAEVVRRRGQPRFRRVLLDAYEGRCCVTEFDAPQALEAAHIIRYRGGHTDHPENGLLLRADVHDLFDLGLLGVRPDAMTVVCADSLVGTRYERLHGGQIMLPKDEDYWPNVRALQKHLEITGLAS